MVDMDRYNRDKAYSASVIRRAEKVYNQLEEWKKACSQVSMTAKSPDRDIALTVNDRGRITMLEMVEGTIGRNTHRSLEALLNKTLAVAQGAATEELKELDGDVGMGDFLAAFDRGLAESG
ncbi:Uncharacterised protein [Mycobacteroides abscessus subsp. bolletii]|uniref:hypothetical protein n=1 Tax=Mycobacteroides abscessus TaxID=36809 RepID=UPI0009A77F1D|nr:hypothetical protein [Mycobacteroides abscessus]QSN49627.1 hypothetical protein I3U33_26485 [Mycobacteroides abscessus subsp. abscessus]SKS74632.1 Uncharacterised protein [Mycobacteroides abscessus subsp. bolletii]SKS82111.1 Uncharacterised protein [Mycobacteroides abscessus subsp. bolletii]